MGPTSIPSSQLCILRGYPGRSTLTKVGVNFTLALGWITSCTGHWSDSQTVSGLLFFKNKSLLSLLYASLGERFSSRSLRLGYLVSETFCLYVIVVSSVLVDFFEPNEVTVTRLMQHPYGSSILLPKAVLQWSLMSRKPNSYMRTFDNWLVTG